MAQLGDIHHRLGGAFVAEHRAARDALLREIQRRETGKAPRESLEQLRDAARFIERAAQVLNAVGRLEYKLAPDPRLELLTIEDLCGGGTDSAAFRFTGEDASAPCEACGAPCGDHDVNAECPPRAEAAE